MSKASQERLKAVVQGFVAVATSGGKIQNLVQVTGTYIALRHTGNTTMYIKVNFTGHLNLLQNI